MSEDFDLAVYIKGDRKPTALYTAKLEIDYINEGLDPAPVGWDVAITDVKFTPTIYIRPDDDDPETPPSDIQSVAVLVENYGPYETPVEVDLACIDKRLNEWVVQPNYFGDVEPPYDLPNDEAKWFYFTVLENTAVEKPATVDCLAEAIAEGDVYPLNNTADFTFKVKKDKELK